MIFRYKTVIYPVGIAVIVCAEFEQLIRELCSNFYNEKGEKMCGVENLDSFTDAFEVIAQAKNMKRYVVICVTPGIKQGTVSHEALHATIDVANAIGADVSDEEWGCYLIGYIADCIAKSVYYFKEHN
jgi:hypothetical protein